jgi:tetratricopeptide (TPR) repeat protein
LITLLFVGDSLGDGPFGKQLGTPQQAAPYYRQAVQIAEELVNADPGNAAAQLEYAQALVHLGVVTPGPEAAAESMRALQKAAALTEAMLVKDPHSRSRRQNLCVAYEMIGERMAAQGKAAESLRYMEKDLAIALALFGEGDLGGRAQTVRAYRGVALAQAALGNRAAALEAIRKMSDFSAGLLKTDPASPVLNAYIHLTESARGAVYDSLAGHSSGLRAGDLRSACLAYSESMAGFRDMPGAASPRFQSEGRKAELGLQKCKGELEEAGR